MKKYILSIDAGTTGITVLIINKKMTIIDNFYQEFTQFYPQPGWVEHDGEEIWTVTKALLTSAFKKYNPQNFAGIGITNQRETTLIWHKKNNKPIYNAIVWQCRRTEPICNELKSSKNANKFIKKTGLVIDSYFSATKIKWILDNVKNARSMAKKGDLAFGTIDSWILWNLTDGEIHATDHTNASRTLIYNIDKLCWDKELLSILNIPHTMLPKVFNSCNAFGKTNIKLFNYSIPITGIAGDQQAALYGQNCINPGDTKCTYGTGCFLLTNTGKKRGKSQSGLLTTLACNINGKPIYAIEGSIFMGGAIIQWMRDELDMLETAKESEKIALSINDSNGIIIVPAFTGLGAPYWAMNARGIITGLTRGVNKKHIIRAGLESIAFQVNDILSAIIKDTKINLKQLKVDGGACENNFLMQFQSDIIDLNITRPKNIESTALGAGMLAGLGAGFWKNTNEMFSQKKIDKIFTPQMDEKTRRNHMKKWNEAVKKVLIK